MNTNKKFVYAVRDSKVNAFAQPFFQRSRAEAMRSWIDCANDKHENNHIARHPEDFALFELGTFDEETGKFENHSQPESLGFAAQFVRQ